MSFIPPSHLDVAEAYDDTYGGKYFAERYFLYFLENHVIPLPFILKF
jgi:hypothetical protein